LHRFPPRASLILLCSTCSDVELATEPFTLPGCDEGGGVKSDIAGGNSILAWIWGRFPAAAPVDDFPSSQPFAFSFPLGMKAGSLYPEVSSQYVSQDGTEYDVPCSVPGASEVEAIVCPAGFVPPRSKDRTEPCIKNCPSPAYTPEEYDVMWTVASAVGVLGLFLNIYMKATWVLEESNRFNSFQLNACVYLGILYGLVSAHKPANSWRTSAVP
jgi:hypothetical protein